jgi:hypothetical protein
MANCGLCGGFTFSGPICSLCANTMTGPNQTITVDGKPVVISNFFSIPPGKARDDAWEKIGENYEKSRRAQGGLKYKLMGELASKTYDKSEVGFFDTVLYGSDGPVESIWNGRSACHRTRPRQNFTVIYVRTSDGGIEIIGTGNHVGSNNNKYTISFDTGATVTCTRS